MPRTYGGKAAEDIEFRMGLMGAALPSRGGLTAGPVTTSASRGSVPGLPGAGIMGTIPGSALGTGAGAAGPPASGGGMTGGQLGLSILGGVASFMGGYQRNPGLLQISRNMNYALRESINQQRADAAAAQAAADRNQIMSSIDPNEPASFEQAGMEALRRGHRDLSQSLFKRADTMVDDARADVKQSFDIEKAIRQQANKELAHNEMAMFSGRAAQAVVQAGGGVNNMSRADDESLMTLWAKVMRPREALMSDDAARMSAAGASGTFQQALSWLNDQGVLLPNQRLMIMRNIATLSGVHAEDYQRKGGDLESMARKYGSTTGSTTKAPAPNPGFDPLQGETAPKIQSVIGAGSTLLKRSVESTLGVTGTP